MDDKGKTTQNQNDSQKKPLPVTKSIPRRSRQTWIDDKEKITLIQKDSQKKPFPVTK